MNIPKLSPLKQIRKNCIDCCCNQYKTIRYCASTDCALWYLRFGMYPKTVIRTKGEKWEQLFDKENFKEGAKFCPNKYVEEYKL